MSVEPVLAATIMLLREGSISPEVLMVQRNVKSESFPDLYVFPGGRVDEQDYMLADRLTGVHAQAMAARVQGLKAEEALAVVVAAIRETYEEAGVLLARSRAGHEWVGAKRQAELARHRLDVQAGRTSLREVVESEDLELAGDSLVVHARWITPEFMPRRFDTFFFTARSPAGQRAGHDGVEASAHVWIRPEDALAQARDRRRRVVFPTAVNLESVAGFTNLGEILDASGRRPVVPIVPRLVQRGDRKALVIPAEAGYETTEAAPHHLGL